MVLSIQEVKSSIEVQQLMSGVYETAYGIFNHVSNIKLPPKGRRPLASVAFHKAEDFTTGSVLEDTMTMFRDLPIKDIFGIDYLQFMKLPVDIAAMMAKVAKERREQESKAAENASKTLKESTKDKRQRQASELRNLPMGKNFQ